MGNYIKSNVIKVGITPDIEVNLDEYIRKGFSIPISLFQASSVSSALSAASTYLLSKREGTVDIPADELNPAVSLKASVLSNGEVRINFITTRHCYPKVGGRPYSDDIWLVGDKIYNTDFANHKCIGWICTSEGSPGVWQQFGNIKAWHTQIEKLNYLPDPSELQSGRQILYTNETNGYSGLFYCDKVGENWRWIQQNMAMGTADQRPSTPDHNWWYFNTTIGYPQWYDANNRVWRTIYDKATYELMWSDYRKELEDYLKDKIDTGYEDVLLQTKEDLDNLYNNRYNDWYELVNSQYMEIIKEPVDNYLAIHPDLIGQRYNIITATVTRGKVDADSGSVTYNIYEVENGNIYAMSIMPNTFLLNFEADMDSSENPSYISIFNNKFKIVDATLSGLVQIKSGAICTLLIDKSKDYCILNSSTKPAEVYSSAKSTSADGDYLYLASSESSYAKLSIRGNENGSSNIGIYSLSNLIELSKLVKVNSSIKNSFQVNHDKVIFNSGSATGSTLEAARITIPIKKDTRYRYYHKEIASSRTLKIDIILNESLTPLAVADSNLNRSVAKEFESNDSTEVTFTYSFDALTNANSSVTIDSCYLVEVPNLQLNRPDFYSSDYLTSKLYKNSEGIYDEFTDNFYIKRLIKGFLISANDKVDYLNPNMYTKDQFVQLSIDLRYSNLGKSAFIPRSDDEISSIISCYSDNLNLVSYNKALSGDKNTLKFGISKLGVLACNVPLNILDEDSKTPLGAFKYILSTELATKAILFVLVEPEINELTLYPTPIRIHKNGVVYIANNNTELELTYPISSAAAAEMNTTILDLLLHQRLHFHNSPLGWNSDITWDEAANNNKDWRGE